ncbi:hypothetical protein EWM64_g5175 [Hericium alpestre]|uniref:Aminoglycoside phosphotransferase domain-containing protein n=1 Tax=Hericium alpestre TaxID=135208 RepID=A0A4Y9ZZG5_9AGAM|nr:hypothetical protein EWM64_g5175 [Hericium alpestre]
MTEAKVVSRESLPSWSELQHLSDDALLDLFRSSPHELLADLTINTTSVRMIGRDTVIKYPCAPYEVAAQAHIASTTSILTPAIRRTIPGRTGLNNFYVVMDFVHGTTLDSSWPRLAPWRKLMVVWTMRRYVRELRKVPFQHASKEPWPGPLGDEPIACIGPLFGEYDAGPFSTYAGLADCFAHKLDVAVRMKKAPPFVAPFDASMPLVFTHLDLVPHNVMLDDAGRVWVIDWGISGFYPQWFEYAAMAAGWEDMSRYGGFLARGIAGFYEPQRCFIDSICWALVTGAFM